MGLGLLKLADTSLILINPSPSNVKQQTQLIIAVHNCHIRVNEFYTDFHSSMATTAVSKEYVFIYRKNTVGIVL